MTAEMSDEAPRPGVSPRSRWPKARWASPKTPAELADSDSRCDAEGDESAETRSVAANASVLDNLKRSDKRFSAAPSMRSSRRGPLDARLVGALRCSHKELRALSGPYRGWRTGCSAAAAQQNRGWDFDSRMARSTRPACRGFSSIRPTRFLQAVRDSTFRDSVVHAVLDIRAECADGHSWLRLLRRTSGAHA